MKKLNFSKMIKKIIHKKLKIDTESTTHYTLKIIKLGTTYLLLNSHVRTQDPRSCEYLKYWNYYHVGNSVPQK